MHTERIRQLTIFIVAMVTTVALPVLFIAASALEGGDNREYLDGDVHRTEFRLPQGHEVIATGDLRIICSVDAEIDGLITADPGVTIEVIALPQSSEARFVPAMVRAAEMSSRMRTTVEV